MHILWLPSCSNVSPRANVPSAPLAVQVADIATAGNPLIYVNQQFGHATGYEAHEVLGRNCRFLQGDETSVAAVLDLKEQMRESASAAARMRRL